MIEPYLWAAFWTVLLLIPDDMQDANAFHGWLKDRYPYALNRWRRKYKNPAGPYEWSDRKWWARTGLVSFLDLWHAAKTVRVILMLGIVCAATGASLWATPALWVLYGGLHDHVFFGRLFK